MTGSEYYQDILETIDEAEVDNMISQLKNVAKFHKITPYQMLIHLIQHKEYTEKNIHEDNYSE